MDLENTKKKKESNALNKVMLREQGHTNPWELRTMLEDILDLANEMNQVSFGLGEKYISSGS